MRVGRWGRNGRSERSWLRTRERAAPPTTSATRSTQRSSAAPRVSWHAMRHACCLCDESSPIRASVDLPSSAGRAAAIAGRPGGLLLHGWQASVAHTPRHRPASPRQIGQAAAAGHVICAVMAGHSPVGPPLSVSTPTETVLHSRPGS